MASRKAYLDYILEQLSDLDNISYRPMMGEYVIPESVKLDSRLNSCWQLRSDDLQFFATSVFEAQMGAII